MIAQHARDLCELARKERLMREIKETGDAELDLALKRIAESARAGFNKVIFHNLPLDVAKRLEEALLRLGYTTHIQPIKDKWDLVVGWLVRW